jgi:hypothetical protein
MIDLRLRQSDLSWRELDGEIVALDNGRSVYVATNSAGTRLWRRLAEGATRDALVDDLRTAFGIDEARAGADVDRFVADLREKGLLEA